MRTAKQFFRDLFRPKAPPPGEKPKDFFPHVFLTPRALHDIAIAEKKRGRQLCVIVTKSKSGEIDALPTPYGNLVHDGITRMTCPEVPCYVINELLETNAAYLVDYIPLPKDPPGTRTLNVPWTVRLPWPSGATASDPGGLRISMAKFCRMHPELMHNTARADAVLKPLSGATYHMLFADANPAIVTSVKPDLIVSAYSGDIDCVVLLRFPSEIGDALIMEHNLKPGRKLISLNSYRDDPKLAADLTPGPDHSGWTNYNPYIAEFLADDQKSRIDELHEAISEIFWQRCKELTVAALKRRPLRFRDGRPLKSVEPATD